MFVEIEIESIHLDIQTLLEKTAHHLKQYMLLLLLYSIQELDFPGMRVEFPKNIAQKLAVSQTVLLWFLLLWLFLNGVDQFKF